jgi:F-type H+-transporting ATPase subunit epsilon
VQGGFAEVLPNAVTVLATVAEKPEEIDLETTRAALAEAESALKTASADELDELTATLRLAETRIKVATGDDA